MYYGEIKQRDIANGEGIRTSLFVSGCRLHCKDCFNKDTWSFSYGQPFTEAVEELILDALKHPYIAGLTVLGGEPMENENQAALLPFLQRVRKAYPQKTIWMFTGYQLEKDLWPEGAKHTPHTMALLQLIDVLVDGPFIKEKKRLGLKFRGSSNQRILDVPQTLAAGKPIIHSNYIDNME